MEPDQEAPRKLSDCPIDMVAPYIPRKTIQHESFLVKAPSEKK